jgi:putative methyltransferase
MPKALKKFKPVLTGKASAHQQQQSRQQQQQQSSRNSAAKHSKPAAAPNKHPQAASPAAVAKRSHQHQQHSQHQQHWSGWRCASIIDQQSAEVLDKLLLAVETRRGGATIKSLTLAPHIVHKKPTFAVTCETLKHLPLLKQLVGDVGLLDQHSSSSSNNNQVCVCVCVCLEAGLLLADA